MKHTKLMAVVILLTLAAGVASAQSSSATSLGDAARAARKNKTDASPATRHYDNDNLPVNDTLSIVGPEPVAAKDPAVLAKDNGATSATNTNKDKDKDKKPADPTVAAADRQKSADEMKKKLAEQQQKIDALNHEISLDQREDRLRAAAFYSDAGTQLRNSAEWQKEQTQSKNDADSKQKALDAARQQYEEMQEQARKAGVKQTDPDASSDRDQNRDQNKDQNKDKQ
jgi:hypothetical protein